MPRLVDVAGGYSPAYTFRYSPSSAVATSVPKRAKRHFVGPKLTKDELRNIRLTLGPTLSLEQAALHAHIAPSTLKRQVCEGKYEGCVKRQKPLVFLTERFFEELFRGTGQ